MKNYHSNSILDAKARAIAAGEETINCRFGDSKCLSLPVKSLDVLAGYLYPRALPASGDIVAYVLSDEGMEAQEFIFEVDHLTGEYVADHTGNYVTPEHAVRDCFGEVVEERNGFKHPDAIAQAEQRLNTPTHSDLITLANDWMPRTNFIRELPWVRGLSVGDLSLFLYKLVHDCEGAYPEEQRTAALLVAGVVGMISPTELRAMLTLWDCIE